MSDYIVRATAANNQIRAFAITSKDLVEEARKRHNTSPVITAGLGRLLSGAAMMGAMMKGDDDLLTLQIKCGGPVQGLTATADAKGNVKGYAEVSDVMLPPNPQGKLDVGGAVGLGILNVIKDMGLKEPYAGQVALQTGEIAEDLTYYFATSEQIPSAVGLGVLMNKDNTGRQAGGFIIQLLPFTDEKIIEQLEKKITEMKSVTEMLEEGMTPEMLLEEILGDFGLEITDTLPAQFSCNCSKERITKALISIGKKDLQEITPPDISQMLEKIKPKTPKKKASHGILVEGEDGFLVHLAKCCNPIPGDQIIGYITRGRGVSVHRADCPNVLREGNDMMRVIDVNWDISTDQSYPVTIEVGCYDRQGILTEIIARISDAKINIENISSRSIPSNKTAVMTITFHTKNLARAEQLMNTLRRLKDVYSVRRNLSSSAKEK